MSQPAIVSLEQRMEGRRMDASASLVEGLSLLVDAAPDAMVVVEKSGTVVLVNRHAERMFDYRRDELVGQPVELLVPERYGEHHARHRERYCENPHARPMGAGLELYGRRRDGSECLVEISLRPRQ